MARDMLEIVTEIHLFDVINGVTIKQWWADVVCDRFDFAEVNHRVVSFRVKVNVWNKKLADSL